ncbi:MAG: hypothetical protein AAF620_06615 [Bacteroidota bacterium]
MILTDIGDKLRRFEEQYIRLPGIDDPESRNNFERQLYDSALRVDHMMALSQRTFDDTRSNPSSDFFNPYKAAVSSKDNEESDEAFWLIF